MKSDVWIGKKGFRYWYYRLRDSQYYSLSLVGFAMIASLALIFYVIIPQLNNWFSIRQEVIATRQRISTLQNNIAFMESLDKGTLNNQLRTASTALPPEKDFGSMLDVLTGAAENAGVSLNDYAFQVGNIASSSSQLGDNRYKNLSSVKIVLVVNGKVENVRRFIQTIENSIPISEVTDIDGNGENVSLSIQFYQKPFPHIELSGDQALSPLSAEKLGLLEKLSSWKSSSGATNSIVPSGSGSAVPLF